MFVFSTVIYIMYGSIVTDLRDGKPQPGAHRVADLRDGKPQPGTHRVADLRDGRH